VKSSKKITILQSVAIILVGIWIFHLEVGWSPLSISAISLVLTLAKIGYDVFDKERERGKKSQEGRERVKVSARYGTWDSSAEELGVVIYNDAATPIHLKSVTLHRRVGGDEEEIEMVNRDDLESELLMPKHTTGFRYGCFKADILRSISQQNENNIWITIDSYQGEICRVGGDEILRVLNAPPDRKFFF
jgi:hypothetical protein